MSFKEKYSTLFNVIEQSQEAAKELTSKNYYTVLNLIRDIRVELCKFENVVQDDIRKQVCESK